jgi:hypothetical protein
MCVRVNGNIFFKCMQCFYSVEGGRRGGGGCVHGRDDLQNHIFIEAEYGNLKSKLLSLHARSTF